MHFGFLLYSFGPGNLFDCSIFVFCKWHACACSCEVHACPLFIQSRDLFFLFFLGISHFFSHWPIILYLSTRGRRSGASLAHPLVLHNGRRRRPAPPGGSHLGQGPLLLPPAPGHQEEPAVGGLSQLLAVLPVRELVVQYGYPWGGAGADREAGQPRPTPHPLLRDELLTKPLENSHLRQFAWRREVWGRGLAKIAKTG